MMQCQKYLDNNLATSAYYCSRENQTKDWPRHKVYHKIMKKQAKEPWSMVKEEDLAVLSVEEATDVKICEGLMKRCGQCMVQNNMKGAKRSLENAIKLDPENPLSHHNLAIIFSNAGHYIGAVREFNETILLFKKRVAANTPCDAYMEMWARFVVSNHALYRDNSGSLLGIPKPRYLADEEVMLICAKQASVLVPSYNE